MIALNNISAFIADTNRHHDGFWWLPFGLLWIVLLGTFAWFVIRNVRPRELSATAILAERYARGELNTEEYHERLEVLRSNP
jgi:putative membrane protein